MAGEIIVSKVDGLHFELVFLFPITTPIEDKDSNNVVPTPSSGLPATVSAVLTTEIAALDAGTMMFERSKFDADVGATQAQILAKVQEMYTGRLPDALLKYAVKYEYAARVGQRFNTA